MATAMRRRRQTGGVELGRQGSKGLGDLRSNDRMGVRKERATDTCERGHLRGLAHDVGPGDTKRPARRVIGSVAQMACSLTQASSTTLSPRTRCAGPAYPGTGMVSVPTGVLKCQRADWGLFGGVRREREGGRAKQHGECEEKDGIKAVAEKRCDVSNLVWSSSAAQPIGDPCSFGGSALLLGMYLGQFSMRETQTRQEAFTPCPVALLRTKVVST
jgi:hypothetical protein